MKRSVLLSTFLFAAVLSPIFLYGYTCAPRPDARLAVLELRAGDFHGENVIEGFSPNVFSYDVPFPESESVGVLWFRAQDPRATIEVQYDGEFVPLAWHSVAKLDVPLGSSELSIKVSVRGSGFLPSSRTYRVRIQRGDLCEGVVCDDQNECTDDVCDSVDGQCVYTNVSHGTTCDLGGLPGECAAGVCQGLCPSIEITPTRMIPNVMFLVDQSGSMAADFGGGLDRWGATHGAIMQIISELDSIVRFGLTTYTSDDGDANPPCPRLPTQVDFALNNSGTIGDPMVYSPTYPTAEGHDTPTGDSIDTLVSIIQSDPPPAEGGTIIVLAIDGEPDSCEVPDPNPTPGARAEAVTAASNSHNAGIDVLLLWIGALTYADTEGHIQEVANVGVGLAVDGSEGDAPFWVGTDPQDLENDFREMIASSISCDVQTDKRFDDKEKACNEGDVRIDGVPLSCPSDWRVKPGVDDVIELVGSACDTFKSGDVTFTATFPCGAIVGGTGGTGGAGGTGGVGGTGGIGGAPGTGGAGGA